LRGGSAAAMARHPSAGVAGGGTQRDGDAPVPAPAGGGGGGGGPRRCSCGARTQEAGGARESRCGTGWVGLGSASRQKPGRATRAVLHRRAWRCRVICSPATRYSQPAPPQTQPSSCIRYGPLDPPWTVITNDLTLSHTVKNLRPNSAELHAVQRRAVELHRAGLCTDKGARPYITAARCYYRTSPYESKWDRTNGGRPSSKPAIAAGAVTFFVGEEVVKGRYSCG
jgi:hypothetical protein